MMRLLIVEDEPRLCQLLAAGLGDRGFEVECAGDGPQALSMASGGSFDALVLDLMLPGCDGIEVLRELRARGIFPLVLLLTARGDVSDRILGLESGADDYMVKPFAIEEVAARLRAMHRRRDGRSDPVCSSGGVTLNPRTREVVCKGERVSLTTREYALLECLVRYGGKPLTRSQLSRLVWNYRFDSGTNIVDVYIKRLREKIGDDGTVIRAIRGVGYMLQP